jgi:hypothetical protein
MNEGIVSAISVFPSGIFYLLLIVIVSASVPARISKAFDIGVLNMHEIYASEH